MIDIIQADYSNSKHTNDILTLLNLYAMDMMGGAESLSSHVRNHLIEELRARSWAFSILAYDQDTPIGLANCFEGFSTFSCKPLINIHDMMVRQEYRRQGVSLKLLEKIELIARARGCCKITLEVLSNNDVAKGAYRKFGFQDYELMPEAGTALFWQKKI